MTVLSTARLDLVPFTDDHLVGLNAVNADPLVMRYITGRPETLDETRAVIERVMRRWREVGYSWWSLIERDSGEIIGAGCLQNLRREMTPLPDLACPVEIGWRLRRDRWGKGLASEAAQAMADFAFKSLRVDELHAVCHPENAASAAVMQRLGMQHAGLQTWYGKELTTYQMTAAQWAARSGADGSGPSAAVGVAVRSIAADQPIDAARLLWQHWQAGTKLAALPDGLRPGDAAQGHAIQAQVPAVSGQPVRGWKIAATSAVGQAHICVSGPLAGRLLADQVAADGASFSLTGNGMRVAEPEFVFRFGADLAPRAQPYTRAEVLAAVAALHTGLEVPDSRFDDFARAGEAQLLADNACAHQFVLGPAAPDSWRTLDLSAHEVRAAVTGEGGRACTRVGSGAAVLGDPRVALTWLVNAVSALGVTLQAGQYVTTGTCMVPLELAPGDRVQADYGVLGSVSASFTA